MLGDQMLVTEMTQVLALLQEHSKKEAKEIRGPGQERRKLVGEGEIRVQGEMFA